MSEHEEDLRPANMLGCEISPNPLDLAPIEGDVPTASSR